MSNRMLKLCSFDYCSFIINFEIGKCKSSSLFLFLKIVLSILSLLIFHINVRISLSVFAEVLAGILVGIMLNL